MTRRVLPNTVGFALDGLTRRVRSIEGLDQTHTLLAVFDSEGLGLTPGVKGDVQLHKRYLIKSWTLLADTTGSIVVDIWKDSYPNYPPFNSNSITGTTEPEIVGSDKATSDDLTAWSSTIIEAGETLRYNIDSVSGLNRVTLALELYGMEPLE